MSQISCVATKENFTNYDLMVSIYDSEIAKAFDLKASSFSVLTGLCRYYNYRSGVVFPSMETLAEKLNLGIRTVTRSIEELVNKGLILKTKKKNKNVYCFANAFWDHIKSDAAKSNKVTSQKVKPACQNDNLNPARLTGTCHEQNKHDQNKNNKVLSFQLTSFQKKYSDVFEILSESELKQYKSLKGYEKEDWLKNKRKSAIIEKNNNKVLDNLSQMKIRRGSPLDYSYEEAVDFLQGLLPELKNSYFAVELRKKWNL